MGLQKATIYDKEDSSSKVTCMFNPSEYTISKSNQFQPTPNKTADSPHMDLKQVGARSLKLNLFFDTYETGEDVNTKTKMLWDFMNRKIDEDGEPIQVVFKWSVFSFVSYITNINQQFTMFTNEGLPVRAKVDVSFTEYIPKPGKQNPTSGGGPPDRLWTVIEGDRLDLIAYKVYNDATQWRLIAERNRIANPLSLRVGQLLEIPKD
jgi:hypothetical protein